MTSLIILIAAWLYIWTGLYCRHRETLYRPRCPRGVEAVTTTILFWPWKIAVVFWKKWRLG